MMTAKRRQQISLRMARREPLKKSLKVLIK